MSAEALYIGDFMKKGDILEVLIEGVRFPNRGYGHIGEDEVVIKNTVPGQKVRFMLTKKRSGRCSGRLIEVTDKSPLETRDPLCGGFPACGGCTYQTLDYEQQLILKEKQVRELLSPVFGEYGITQDVYEGIVHAAPELPYRNKMEYTFGDAYKGGPLVLGLHKKDSNHDIVACRECVIVNDDFNMIADCVEKYCRDAGMSFYHRMSHEGYLRNLLIRRSERLHEIMIALVATSQEDHCFDGLVSDLTSLKLEGKITGILHMTYDGVADIVRSERTDILFGRDHIFDEMSGMRFKISPFSFFQTNTRGAELLYATVGEFIGDIEDAEVFDLYCGTGTITQMLSKSAAHVTGVEIVPEAVDSAVENAAANNIKNCDFICGDVLQVIEDIPEKPDCIVLDPPRDGVNAKALQKIIDFGAKRIVYVSCKPTSLVRDLEILCASGYEIKRVKCVDMFPMTVHVESCVLLERVSNRKADSYVKLNVKMADYYRIKDSAETENAEE